MERLLRALMVALCRLVLRVFFRRIQIYGEENIPKEGGVLFFLNHPNGLIDPLFVLGIVPRPVSFLAKAPLFKMPLVGLGVKALGCLPVYRKQDGAQTKDNAKTLRLARQHLQSGGAVAIFPEGRSHSDPSLSPFKTGGVRIALSAGPNTHIVPVAIVYDDKKIFRSKAAVFFGEALAVPKAPLDPQGEPPREVTHALNAQAEKALSALLPQAPSKDILALAQVAAQALADGSEEASLFNARMLKLLQGYQALMQSDNRRLQARVKSLMERLEALAAKAQKHAIPLVALKTAPASKHRSLHAGLHLVSVALLLAPGTLGLVIHYLPYRGIGILANRVASQDEDIVATVKVLGALVVFPLVWLLVCIGIWFGVGLPMSHVSVVAPALPVCAWAAMRLGEEFLLLARDLRVLRLGLSGSQRMADLQAETLAIRQELFTLAEKAGLQ